MKNNVDNKNNNKVVLTGEIVSTPVYNHEVFGEKFYTFDMEVPRNSDACDVLPIMVSDRLLKMENIKVGNLYKITGQFRSYNKQGENRKLLILSVFAREIRELEAEEFVG